MNRERKEKTETRGTPDTTMDAVCPAFSVRADTDSCSRMLPREPASALMGMLIVYASTYSKGRAIALGEALGELSAGTDGTIPLFPAPEKAPQPEAPSAIYPKGCRACLESEYPGNKEDPENRGWNRLRAVIPAEEKPMSSFQPRGYADCPDPPRLLWRSSGSQANCACHSSVQRPKLLQRWGDLTPRIGPERNTIWTKERGRADEQEQTHGGADHRCAEAG